MKKRKIIARWLINGLTLKDIHARLGEPTHYVYFTRVMKKLRAAGRFEIIDAVPSAKRLPSTQTSVASHDRGPSPRTPFRHNPKPKPEDLY